MSLAKNGDYVASTGRDRSLRFWQRSQEIVLPDEEREMEREAEDDKLLVRSKEPIVSQKKKNLDYSRSIMPKRVTSGGARICCLAFGQHSSEEINSGGEPLATLFLIGPTRGSNLGPSMPLAIS